MGLNRKEKMERIGDTVEGGEANLCSHDNRLRHKSTKTAEPEDREEL